MEDIKQQILELLKDEKLKKRNIEQLASTFKQVTSKEFVAFIKIMNELEDDGYVYRDDKNDFYATDIENTFEGIIKIHKQGFGFVLNDQDDLGDIFVPKDKMKGAYSGDTVLVAYKSSDADHREGKVVRIVKRGNTKVVGELLEAKRECYITFEDAGKQQRIYVDYAHLHGAVKGNVVQVQIKTYKPILRGDVVKILGHVNDPGIDILSEVYDHDIDIEFPDEVYKQIESIGDEIDKSDLKNRKDLRNDTIVTIDGDDAKDLDDAISLRRMNNGHYKLGVHIADVSFYVPEGSPLDKEALHRGTSVYLVDRVIPMLPHKLSNGICSLNPHVDRYTVSCLMEIDEEGNVVDHEILPTVINSTERMTYNNVNKVLAGDKEMCERYAHVEDMFLLMEELANILHSKRNKRGAIDFDTKEAKVLVDKEGKPYDVVLRSRGISEGIIEEFMLTANETIAQHFKWMELPFIYRVHELPDKSKLQNFVKVASSLGYKIHGSLDDVRPNQLQEVLAAAKGEVEFPIISTLLLRCMQKARYDEECLGHFGLADEYYTHFTSPIRRYPDLMVHRLIHKYLFDQKMDEDTLNHYHSIMQEIADKTSSCEREAIQLERDVDDMKMAEYMEDHIGEEFDGIITSITNFGFFVELDNTIEGLVHVLDLCDDYYIYDPDRLQYIGQKTRKVFKMSDEVRIRVKAASKKDKTIDFEIVGMKSNKRTKKNVIMSEHSKKNTYYKSYNKSKKNRSKDKHSSRKGRRRNK